MAPLRLTFDEIDRLGESIYESKLRKKVTTKDNIGKLLSIDVETGDYEIADDLLVSGQKLRARNPDALMYGVRIGYNAVLAVGGTIERTIEN